jgi:hypothetical protein
MRFLALAGALAAIATPVVAQDQLPISLAPEEAITLRLDENGATLAREGAGRAQWTPHDLAVARYMSGLTPPKEPSQSVPLPDDASVPPADPVQPGRLRLRFLSIAGQHMMLIIDNGYDRAVAYRARMTRDGDETATDVCLIMPMRHSYEHWPHRIERIALSDFRFVPWNEGDPNPCA